MPTLLLLVLVSQPSELPIEVTLSLSADVIRTGDPLFVKATIQNRDNEPIHWFSAPDFAFELQIEQRVQGSTSYDACRTREGGDDVEFGPMIMAGNSRYSAFDVLLPSENPALQEPGSYQLRVRVAQASDKEGTDVRYYHSLPVELMVQPRDQGEVKLIHAMRREIDFGVSTQFSNSGTLAKELYELEISLKGPSVLKTSIVWSRMIREYDPASTCANEQLVALQNVRLIVDPVTSEVISLCLASRLRHYGQWQGVLEVLHSVEERNVIVENIRAECRARINPKE
ncbi:MAG: hypothetical protein ABI614_15430 [Planctomycetota bacterium]